MLNDKPWGPQQWANPRQYGWNSYDWSHGGNSYYSSSSASEHSWSPFYRANKIEDYGPRPFVINIEEATKRNNNYRTALWTGNHLQVTLMCINVGEDIGLEVHPEVDQFLRIEEGEGLVQMGDKKEHLNFQEKVHDNDAILVPAGTWHNVINSGKKPLKLYTIYAPPNHPHGTVQATKAIAMAEEGAEK